MRRSGTASQLREVRSVLQLVQSDLALVALPSGRDVARHASRRALDVTRSIGARVCAVSPRRTCERSAEELIPRSRGIPSVASTRSVGRMDAPQHHRAEEECRQWERGFWSGEQARDCLRFHDRLGSHFCHGRGGPPCERGRAKTRDLLDSLESQYPANSITTLLAGKVLALSSLQDNRERTNRTARGILRRFIVDSLAVCKAEDDDRCWKRVCVGWSEREGLRGQDAVARRRFPEVVAEVA